MQTVEQTHEEKLAMYMKEPKKKLCEMIIQCNKIIGWSPGVFECTMADGSSFTTTMSTNEAIAEGFKEMEIMICDCNSIEHQAKFYYWKGENYDTLNILIHLTSYKNVFKRIWYALKYVCGHTSNYGAWDEFLISEDNKKKLYEFLKDNLNIK